MATHTKEGLVAYASSAVVPLVDPLVKRLLLEQPADVPAFCRAYFESALRVEPGGAGSTAAGGGGGQGEAAAAPGAGPDVAALQERIAALEAENGRLQAVAAPHEGCVAPGSNPDEAFVVNWNLAGVNTNAFEFHLSDDPRHAAAIAFAREMDGHVRAVLLADGEDSSEDEDEQPDSEGAAAGPRDGATCHHPLFKLLAPMTVAELLHGLPAAACPEGSPAAKLQLALAAALETPPGGGAGAGAASALSKLRSGLAGREFSKPDSTLKDRGWCVVHDSNLGHSDLCIPSQKVPGLRLGPQGLHKPQAGGLRAVPGDLRGRGRGGVVGELA
eukprot:SAG22_NODE_2368_length_2652_cov_2.835096_3_plen_330_part_00